MKYKSARDPWQTPAKSEKVQAPKIPDRYGLDESTTPFKRLTAYIRWAQDVKAKRDGGEALSSEDNEVVAWALAFDLDKMQCFVCSCGKIGYNSYMAAANQAARLILEGLNSGTLAGYRCSISNKIHIGHR